LITVKYKNILVIGATSLVGKFLLSRLSQAGYATTALSRGPVPYTIEGADPKIRWVQADILANNDPLPGPGPYDAIISLAPIWVTASFSERASIPVRRLVALSSTSVHTKAASSSLSERELAARLHGGENSIMERCGQLGIKWTILRPTMIHGEGKDGNVASIVRFITRFGFFPVVGDGGGLRAPVHADEVAGAALGAMECDSAQDKAYDISGGQTITYRKMIERIFTALGKKPRIAPIPLWMARGGLRALSFLPPFAHLNPELANRMSMDMAFDHSAATGDFGYDPGPFTPDIGAHG